MCVFACRLRQAFFKMAEQPLQSKFERAQVAIGVKDMTHL